MLSTRRCSRNGCGRSAVATLTYVYSDSTAVVGPLALEADPGSYDLCTLHSTGLSVPRGWSVIRLEPPQPDVDDDLWAIAGALTEPPAPDDLGPETTPLIGSPTPRRVPSTPKPADPPSGRRETFEVGRRGHLTLLRHSQPAHGDDDTPLG